MTASNASATARPRQRPDHPTLTEARLHELRGLLEADRAGLLKRAGAPRGDDRNLQPSATHGIGETEQTTDEIERRVNDVLEANARDALGEIGAALARIDEGTYGLCRDCARPIPYERLAAMPAARCCVRCQQQHDARR